jgi:formylglycine-generating enzyme
MPVSSSSPLPGLFKGLFCLLVPIAVVVAIFRAVSGRSARQSPPPVSDSFLRRPPPQPIAVPVRKTDDGFWVHGDWPDGTLLTVRYMVAGTAMVQELLYRPGDDGQFVFTGSEPDSVSVVAGNDPQDQVSQTIFSTPPPFPQRRQDDDDDDRRRPPIFPSAY